MTRKIYIARNHLNDIMKKKSKVKSLDELKVLNESEKVFVRVHYNGVEYICEVENDDGIRMGTEIKPKGYQVEGIFIDGYDEPKIGQKIREKILLERNISLSGYNGLLIYGRILDNAPASAEDLRKEISAFVEEVVQASREVDKMILQYVSKRPKRMPPKFRKYLRGAI